MRDETSVIAASIVDPAVPPRAAKCNPTVVLFRFRRFNKSMACSLEISMMRNLSQGDAPLVVFSGMRTTATFKEAGGSAKRASREKSCVNLLA